MELSPSERFELARDRQSLARTEFGAFARGFDFELDDFQVQACQALEAGHGVLVAAPTGAGKTIVGEFAIVLALSRGKKAFYTTPIKALSNQKYAELAAVHGADQVGLLTGDTSINPEAPVVVMTTEVLRNMLYAGSGSLRDLAFVVMDEVHYLADRFRGAVWEEVIIHLPESVQLVSLSATVSNAEEFGAWLDAVRGSTEVIVSEVRPVPLWQHVLHGRDLIDLFADDGREPQPASQKATDGLSVNSWLVRTARAEAQQRFRSRGSGGPRGGSTRGRSHRLRTDHGPGSSRPNGGSATPGFRPPSRAQVVATLDEAGLLPAITFIFSRAGCDAAVRQCVDAGLSLTTPEQREVIRVRVDEACREIPEDDLTVLGFWSFREGLLRGIAAHHAGMLPTFKELVEELFAEGLLRAVFATETLALGVNMPARSVVLEKLEKFNGESHVNITAGEYTQLTGRAGRRGIDVEGHAVVLWQPGIDPTAIAGLASRRTYPLNSSFRPTYNMSVNLIAQFGRDRSRQILESSFAQFQADRSVVGLARQVRSREESLAGYVESMTCHLGDFAEYARLRRELSDAENRAAKHQGRARRDSIDLSLAALRPGDIVRMGGGRGASHALVVSLSESRGEMHPLVLNEEHEVFRLTRHDLDAPIAPVAHLALPKGFRSRNPTDRKQVLAQMRQLLRQHSDTTTATPSAGFGIRRDGDAEAEITRLRRVLRAHPCHGCSDREAHARWAERWWKLRRETDALVRQIQGRTGTIAATFDRVCDLLQAQGFLAPGPETGQLEPTAKGQRLRRLYGEKDLLIALCLSEGALDALDAQELAAFAAALVYQAKREESGQRPRMPTPGLESAVTELIRQWSLLSDAEEQARLPVTVEPDLGLVWPMHKWARGRRLEQVLDGTELAAGDFVRWAKQVIDILDQIAKAPGISDRLHGGCLEAIRRVRRGVVAYSGLGEQ